MILAKAQQKWPWWSPCEFVDTSPGFRTLAWRRWHASKSALPCGAANGTPLHGCCWQPTARMLCARRRRMEWLMTDWGMHDWFGWFGDESKIGAPGYTWIHLDAPGIFESKCGHLWRASDWCIGLISGAPSLCISADWCLISHDVVQAFVENDYAAGIELLPATHNCKGMRKLAMNLLLVEVGDYCDLPCSNANIIYIIIIMHIYISLSLK